MLNYLDTKNILFTRGITFDYKQYLFALQVALGEDKRTAYGLIYDRENFLRMTESEEEEDYLASIAHDADIMLQQQECSHLYELLNDEYKADIQAKASTLEDYKFTGADIQRLLSNLLHNRSESLDDASVKDILSLVKSMFDSGYLDSDDSFQRHFITVAKKYDALCTSCNREIYAVEGINIVCKHCGQVFTWDENAKRFYPKLAKL